MADSRGSRPLRLHRRAACARGWASLPREDRLAPSPAAGASSAPGLKARARAYWTENPNARKHGGTAPPGTKEFFEAVAAQRYAAEPCIAEMARFADRRDLRVLDLGCGMGVDARSFAEAGARVVGADFSANALRLARDQFAVAGQSGGFVLADAENLPFKEGSFDLVWNHGVIHHTPDTARCVEEIHRVLRPGGEAIVMVYHRDSYHARFLVPWLARPAVLLGIGLRRIGLGALASRLLPTPLRKMVDILAAAGYSYDALLALSTDLEARRVENHNPLSQFFRGRDANWLFHSFAHVRTEVRQLYWFPPLPSALRRRAERMWGFFLYFHASKARSLFHESAGPPEPRGGHSGELDGQPCPVPAGR